MTYDKNAYFAKNYFAQAFMLLSLNKINKYYNK